MEKTKKQKIAYSVFTVVLVIVLGVVLLNRFGIIDFEKEVNKVTNSDYYWQSEPFGEIDAVWCLENVAFDDGNNSIFYYLRSADESKEYTHGDGVSVKKIAKLDYDDIEKVYALYTYNDICYTALFVPLDCEYVEINGERFPVKTGKINTPEGELEFRYFTAAYKSISKDEHVQDKLVLYSKSGRSYERVENIYD